MHGYQISKSNAFMMWTMLAAPWLARPSRRAASILSRCCPSALQQDPLALVSSVNIRLLWIALFDHSVAHRAAATPTVQSIQHGRDSASESPLVLHQPFPPISPPVPVSYLGPSVATAFCTATAPGPEAPSAPTQATPPSPLPTESSTSDHISSAFTIPVAAPVTQSAAERDPPPSPAPADANPDASALAAAFFDPGPSHGPSVEVLQLMGQIRRSRSAVDLRLLLTRQAALADHLALVAAMTRLTQLSAASRRATDRTAQLELVLELAETLAFSAHLPRCGARQLGTCLHSLAELGVVPSEKLWEALLDALCTDRSALLVAGNAVDVSVLALALARLNCSSRRAWRAVARGVEAHSASMSPQHVANTLSALARAGAHEHRAAFASLLSRAITDMDALSGRNLANALWASIRHLEALGGLAQEGAPKIRATECAEEGKKDETFYVNAGSNPADDVSDIAQILAFSAALARRLPERLRQCPPTELAGVAWSLDRLGWREWSVWSSLGAQLRLSAGAMKPVELCTTAEALQAASARAAIQGASVSTAPLQTAAEAAVEATPTVGTSQSLAAAAAAAAAAGSTGMGCVDPGAALTALFTAASLRIRELRPQHLARLLQVLRQRVAVQHTAPVSLPPPPPPPPSLPPTPPSSSGASQQHRQGGLVVGSTPLSTSASVDLGSKRQADGPDGQILLQDTAIFEGFVREARAQLLRANQSAFPDLGVVSSLVSSLCIFGGPVMPGNEQASAGPYSESSVTRPGPGGSARDDNVSAAAEPTAAAVLDRLAVAAAPLAAAASAAELRSVMAAFAAAGHFNSELCTAVATRVETLARQVNIRKITTGLQHPLAAASRHRQRLRHRQQDAAFTAVVAEVADLLGSLRALADLGFHNEGALDATQPTVAAAAAALPPAVLSAALAVYTASGAVPLALASALAAELLGHLRKEGSALQPRSDLRQRLQQHQQDAGCLTEDKNQQNDVEGTGTASVPWEERNALLEACQRWRASLLYPGGLAGTVAVRAKECGDGASRLGGNGVGLRIASCNVKRSIGAAAIPRGFDRCLELVTSLDGHR
ncbi:hypothetical protein VaNZ11_015285 [Volvox africanus]|uniref:RAP domain-containing protein n=1 Tax=Volvox africanus TaxID=51714 RepID=A0ABQ5SKA1_9CHLO|nr:hypothetical protein VaNZ11_015285 [Volvox africanus]